MSIFSPAVDSTEKPNIMNIKSKEILKKHKDWSAYVVGDEPRDKLNFKHNRLKNFGFKEHNEVIKIYKKTSIAVACSRWEEPFGRTSLEASSRGCSVIISNRGGLPETITNGVILKKLNYQEHTYQ